MTGTREGWGGQMLDGRLLIDAHVHAARLPTLKPAWRSWAEQFGQPGWTAAYTEDGTVSPGALDDLMAAEGVDHAILLCEYSPKVTGIQPVCGRSFSCPT